MSDDCECKDMSWADYDKECDCEYCVNDREERRTPQEIKERIRYWEGETGDEDSCGWIEYYKKILRKKEKTWTTAQKLWTT